MKRIISSFKKLIRFAVSIFASREMGFIYCIMATIAQIAHTYYLTVEISSFTGDFKIFQAILISIFISSSLLFFVAIADDSDTSEAGKKESRNIRWAINIFVLIELLINVYYYSRHLIIDSDTMQLFDFIFAVLVSTLLPVTVKLYAGLIKAKEWYSEFEIKSNKKSDSKDVVDENYMETIANDLDDLMTRVDNNDDRLVDKLEELSGKINQNNESLDDNVMDEKISKIFEKQQELFLKQFENKIKLITNNNSK